MDCGDGDKRDVRRPMNAFLIFCKRHRSIVREKNPDLDNRSVTRILGDLWANLKEEEKSMYTDLAKQVCLNCPNFMLFNPLPYNVVFSFSDLDD